MIRPLRQSTYHSRRAPLNLFLLALIMLVSVGCFGGSGEEGTDTVDPNQGTEGDAQSIQKTLACSEACANLGQCGQADDGTTFVLAKIDQPNTKNHDLLFPVNEPVNAIAGEQKNIQLANGEQTVQAFSYVSLSSNSDKKGWIMDVCIAQP